KVVNGAKTRFWLDCWLGEQPLGEAFPRLLSISLNKESVIVDMGDWTENSFIPNDGACSR
ncbi:hypothetical protein A2U01_0004716, partial [Trifolium medium]|nr:hypothetical protein [Trifolium medium]